jgi:circadian clock protein KaiC
MAAHFAAAACQRGEHSLYLTFEESPRQITRNMRSIGIDLESWVRKGLLRLHAARSSLYGLEMHLVTIHHLVEEFKPGVVIVDSISNFLSVGTPTEVKATLTRLIDFLKSNDITGLFTSLTVGRSELEQTDVTISSLMDTWLLLRDFESSGERNRGLYVLKSRGMAHSNQVREFLLTDEGVQLLDVYAGPSGMLMGSARHALEVREQAEAQAGQREIERNQRLIEQKRQALEAQVAALRAQFEAEEQLLGEAIVQEEGRREALATDRTQVAQIRKADLPPAKTARGARHSVESD